MRGHYAQPSLHIHPPPDLFEKIMRRIEQERKIILLKRKLAFYFVSFSGSLAALFPAFNAARAGFAESGFGSYFSLLFSDTGTVLTYSQNFGLSLLESLPIISLSFLCVALIWLFASLRFIETLMKNFFTSQHLHTHSDFYRKKNLNVWC